MILVVNPNLAVDYLLDVGALRPGAVHRSKSARRQAGGKGVNVARVLKTLGEPCTLAGFLGGRGGEFIADELGSEGIAFDCTRVGGESRTCLILSDDSNARTVVNEPGPLVEAEDWSRFVAAYERLLAAHEIVVITGSLPPGLAPDSYTRLVHSARERGRATLLDCAQPWLADALAARPSVVKVNAAEAGELLGGVVGDSACAATAAAELIRMGARRAMVTLGARGAAYACEGFERVFTAPRVEAANSVGSGDAAMAGLAAGLSRGLSNEGQAMLAVAAGAANALRGMGRCTAEEIESMLAEVERGIEQS